MLLCIKIALRYLFSPNKGSFSSFASWLAIGGLSIGITALLLTASIINGFHTTISQKLASLEGYGRIQHILGKTLDLNNTTLDSLYQSYPNKLYPYIRGICMARSKTLADGMIVEGVDVLPMEIDKNQALIKPGTIVIGETLAQQLSVKKGDQLFLQVFASKNNNYAYRRIKAVSINKIYKSGLQEYDKSLVFINLNDARKLFEYGEDQITGLIINDKNIYNQISRLDYPFHTENWKDRHSMLFKWIKLQQWPAYIMFGLIALVGIVNIIAAIVMIIIEKSGQIGILIAQGTNTNKLKAIFMIQGGFIGLISAFIGGGLSIVIIWIQLKFEILSIPSEIYFMDHIPLSFHLPIFGLILLVTFICCMIASWWPTKALANFNPSKILNYE